MEKIKGNNMKQLMITAFAGLLLAGQASAQRFNPYDYVGVEPDNGFSVMLLGGMTVSNFKMNDLGAADMSPKVGFDLGLRAEYMLPQCGGVFINGGLEYKMKGARKRVGGTIGDMLGLGATWVSRPMYVSAPIHVGYRYDVLDDLGLYADFGPYFAVGTNGKTRLMFDDFSSDDVHDVFRNENDPHFYEVQRWDFGLGFRVGAEYARHYNFQVGCDWGITDMLTQEQKHVIVVANPLSKNPTLRNFNASLIFAYRF